MDRVSCADFFFFPCSQPTSPLDKSTDSSDVKKGAKEKPSLPQKPAAKPPESLPTSAESKKKPVGAVSLFGGINVLAKKQTKIVSDEHHNGDDNSRPPNVKTQEKVKTNALSLFDDDEVEDEHDAIFTPSKPTARNTAKVCVINSFHFYHKNSNCAYLSSLTFMFTNAR